LKYENTGEYETMTASQWRDKFISLKWSVSGFGTVFDQNEKGIVPTILEDWYDKRKEFKKKSKDAFKKGDIEKGEYFDRLQYVMKIKLNSYYGALTNKYFRFFDLRLGESTTGTGRMIAKHQCRKVCELLEDNYDVEFPLYYSEEDAIDMGEKSEVALMGKAFDGTFQSKNIIAADTDSVYFTIPADNKEDAVAIADAIAEKVNESFPQFMRDTFLCNKNFDDKIASAREMVASRGLFIEKKRYILRIVDVEGKAVDKLKIMGVELKKTTLPKPIKQQLTKFIRRLLEGESWDTIAKDIVEYKKDITKAVNILNVGLPKGVKRVEHYTKEYEIVGDKARLPGHVAASIMWNQCLVKYDDKESPKIMSGMKIKVFYLTQKFGKFKSIAVPVDIEHIPKWFEDEFMPLINVSLQIQKIIDKPLENMIKTIGKKSPTEQSLFVDSLLEF